MCEAFWPEAPFACCFRQRALPRPDRGGRYDHWDEEQRSERELLKQSFLRFVSAYPDIFMLPDLCSHFYYLGRVILAKFRFKLLDYWNVIFLWGIEETCCSFTMTSMAESSLSPCCHGRLLPLSQSCIFHLCLIGTCLSILFSVVLSSSYLLYHHSALSSLRALHVQ